MWIERYYGSVCERLAREFPAVLLTGPRQVGKTALLRHDYPHSTYVSFDHPAVARQAESNPNEFFASLKEPVILDEVQYVPEIFRHLKVLIDRNRKNGRFFLTGSQSFSLMEGVSESLAGRCGIAEMHSLSLDEISRHDSSVSDAQYIIQGGFPELYKGGIENVKDWFGSYLATYLERDVRNVRNVGDLRDFERLLRALASRTAQLLSYSDLARDVGIAPNTAKQWISILRASGQIYLLEPYFESHGKRLIKSPKLYLMDTGLACYLTGISSWEDLIRSPLTGAIWETFIVGEVVRYFLARGEKYPLWFWRTAYGDEVDLLIERGGRFIAIEAKFAESPSGSDWKGIKALKDFYGEKRIERSYLACRTKHPYLNSDTNTKVIPASSIGKRKLEKSRE
ncbi:MAG: ATP-binding protein [Deltaproteobacteria bacterium]|nr:ATP-binding protein [Deltaproteobacteria bacterium]